MLCKNAIPPHSTAPSGNVGNSKIEIGGKRCPAEAGLETKRTIGRISVQWLKPTGDHRAPAKGEENWCVEGRTLRHLNASRQTWLPKCDSHGTRKRLRFESPRAGARGSVGGRGCATPRRCPVG